MVQDMIDVKMQYQASFFTDAQDIRPVPDTITCLMEAFRDRGLIPSAFQEIGSTSPAPQPRIQLSSPNGEWRILFTTEKIDITKNPTDSRGTNIGEVSDFCSDVYDFFRRILTAIPKRGKRLALVTTFLLEKMTEEELAGVYGKLFKPPAFYIEHPPFEWRWRSAASVPSAFMDPPQSQNVLLSVNRLRGEFYSTSGVEIFDRLQLILDINTSPENSDYRFQLQEVKSFYETNLELHSSFLSQTLEYIHE